MVEEVAVVVEVVEEGVVEMVVVLDGFIIRALRRWA